MAKFHRHILNHSLKMLLFTKTIVRVHGKSHPELTEVRALYQRILAKTRKAKNDKPDLDQEFAQLRELTQQYAVPDDACDAFTAVYKHLRQADELYSAWPA